MKKQPITHLILDTSSSNEFDNGDCDYCLIEMTAEYVAYLLDYMDEVRKLRRADRSFYTIEGWDAGPRYFRFNDVFQELRDIDGDLVADVPRGEPILLAAAPGFGEEDFQRVECQTVQVTNDDVWWSAYVKHSGIRIESAQIQKKTLLRIQRSLGAAPSSRTAKRKPSHPAVRRIHDLLYLDTQDGRKFYNSMKEWNADTMTAVADIIAEYIPRPPRIDS